ncbi:MAG: transposase [Candidatus Acidiferrales bacterium]
MKPSKMLSRFMEMLSEGLSKPMTGYVRDMIFGISVGRSTMLSEIGRSLGEEAELITTEMRLSRNLVNRNIDEAAMLEHYLQAVEPFVQDAVIALDFSDIRKEYAEKQEWLCGIWDDTRKEKAYGYWLLNIEAIDGERRHFPLWLEPFSQNAPGYKSQADVVESAIKKVAAHTGKKCVWVLDRGYDGASYIEILERAGLTYCVRQTGRRKVLGEDGIPALTSDIAAKVETPHMGTWHSVVKGREYPFVFRYGSARITFPADGVMRRLIVVKVRNHKTPLMLLTNSAAPNLAAISNLIIAYFKRWGIEEGTRLVKQVFDLENVRAMSFAGIRRIVLFAYLAYGFLCLFARKAGKTAMCLALRFYKSFAPNVPPHFIYYRLAHALAAIFLSEGPPGDISER